MNAKPPSNTTFDEHLLVLRLLEADRLEARGRCGEAKRLRRASIQAARNAARLA